ncbi:MAG: alpha/beta hydrolase [Bacteroidota bacterium]
MFEFRSSAAEMETAIMKYGQYEPHFHQYQKDGRDMHYVHVGVDTLPLVLMVHGAPGSANNMTDYLRDKRLTAAAQVVAVDRPGYGFSGFGKAERSVEKQAAAFMPILEKHMPPNRRKVILVGHSFGGPVIARMAMDYPQLVDGLVIVAGSVAPELEPEKWYQKPLDWFCFRWMLPPAARVCNQEIIPLPEELEKMLPLWKNITCPVTLVHGTKDNLVPVGNVDFAEGMLTNSPQIKIDTLKDQNHFILWSHRDLIVDRIIELINEKS